MRKISTDRDAEGEEQQDIEQDGHKELPWLPPPGATAQLEEQEQVGNNHQGKNHGDGQGYTSKDNLRVCSIGVGDLEGGNQSHSEGPEGPTDGTH